MNCFKVATLFTLIATTSVQADGSTINVSGKITPPACSAIVNGGDNLVWDPISHNSLNASTFTVLPAKPITLQVACDSGLMTHIAFWVTDPNRATAISGIQIPNTICNSGNDINRAFGLGIDPLTSKMIGNFTLVGRSSTYDGTSNTTNFGYTSGAGHSSTSFSAWPVACGYNFNEDWTVLDSTSKPASANLFTFTFDVVPQINNSTQITNAQEVPFTGAAQFYVRYF